MALPSPSIAVVIPCFRVSQQILGVIARIGAEVDRVIVVDDACPERSGDIVAARCDDPRVKVLHHDYNRGVGGAMITGYRAALDGGADIVVKLDGDGQMDPCLIPRIIRPVIVGQADYAKGNRFFDLESLRTMPYVRLFGNSALSMISKAASGYWDVMDPTNGFTAIHRAALARLPLAKIDSGYFFESDMLARLYTLRAVVRDVPIAAHYADESSGLRVGRVVFTFPLKYLRATGKRIFYSYFLRDFNAGTLQLLAALVIGGAGAIYGAAKWIMSAHSGIAATSGEVMMAALPVLVGVQFLIAALQFDIQNVPREPLQQRES